MTKKIVRKTKPNKSTKAAKARKTAPKRASKRWTDAEKNVGLAAVVTVLARALKRSADAPKPVTEELVTTMYSVTRMVDERVREMLAAKPKLCRRRLPNMLSVDEVVQVLDLVQSRGLATVCREFGVDDNTLARLVRRVPYCDDFDADAVAFVRTGLGSHG